MNAPASNAPAGGRGLSGLFFLHFVRGLLKIRRRIVSWARQRPTDGPENPDRGADVLLTGTFYSGNWIDAHVRPIAMSACCRRVRMVSVNPVPPVDGLEWVRPAPWLARLAGGTVARLATFFWVGFRTRPDVVGGFHLLLNGLAAGMLAPMIGARSWYFCVGGPREVLDGGVHGENRLFRRIRLPDPTVERLLIEAVSGFDTVITMGSGAIRFFRERGVTTDFRIVPGGMDERMLTPGDAEPDIDAVLVARISSVKRVDLFLDAVRIVAGAHPTVRVAVVGDGPLLDASRRQAEQLGIADNVEFAGHQDDVRPWLRRSRLFVLTSDSEGLSLALMESMMCGLPAVVSAVGDLGDLVVDGVNGYLVRERTPEAFAVPIAGLIGDEGKRRRFAAAALESSKRYRIAETVRLWDRIISGESAPRQTESPA